MSARLDQSRARVQNMIGDTNPSDQMVEPDALDEIIARHYQQVAADLDMPMTWTEDAITLTAGDYDVDLTDTLEYRLIAFGRLASDGQLVYRVAPEVLEAMRLVPVSEGDPYLMAFREKSNGTVGDPQVVTALFYPTPKEGDAVDLLFGSTPALVSADADAIGLGELGVRAVECYTAAECVARIPADKLLARGVDKGLMGTLQSQAAEAKQKERYRLRRLTASATVGR